MTPGFVPVLPTSDYSEEDAYVRGWHACRRWHGINSVCFIRKCQVYFWPNEIREMEKKKTTSGLYLGNA